MKFSRKAWDSFFEWCAPLGITGIRKEIWKSTSASWESRARLPHTFLTNSFIRSADKRNQFADVSETRRKRDVVRATRAARRHETKPTYGDARVREHVSRIHAGRSFRVGRGRCKTNRGFPMENILRNVPGVRAVCFVSFCSATHERSRRPSLFIPFSFLQGNDSLEKVWLTSYLSWMCGPACAM